MPPTSPVLLLIDDAQWLDAASADVIAHAARRVDGRRIRAVIAERWPDREDGARHRRSRRGAHGAATEQRTAGPGVGAGGRPLGDAAAAPGRVRPLRGRSPPRPCSTSRCRRWPWTSWPSCSTSTNCRCGPPASCTPTRAATRTWPWRSAARSPTGRRPTGGRCRCRSASTRCCATGSPRCRPRCARRCCSPRWPPGRRSSCCCGPGGPRPSTTSGSRPRPGCWSPTAASSASPRRRSPRWSPRRPTAAHRSQLHTALSTVVTDAVERTRHQALASANPDAEVARSLVTAAENARRRGALHLAAELYLLAADRTPAELDAQRLEWLVAAAEAGGAAGRPEIVNRAAEAVLAADATPEQRVRVRITLIDLAGQALADMDEMFAAALADAGDDPGAGGAAAAAAGLAGDDRREPAAGRGRGRQGDRARPRGRRHLDRGDGAGRSRPRSCGCSGGPTTWTRSTGRWPCRSPPWTGWSTSTPRYLAARMTMLDDRLEEAREDLFRMLALVERGGGEELSAVLRTLSEVSAQAGRCAEALDFAGRMIRVNQEAGLQPRAGLVHRGRRRAGRRQHRPGRGLRRAGAARVGAGERLHLPRPQPARARPGQAARRRRPGRGGDAAPDPSPGVGPGCGRAVR